MIVVDASGAAQAVEFDVDITHTFIGDLEVSLSGPTGKRVMVHRRRGGSDDNLITTYSSSAAGPLTPFVGLDVHGEWTLKVTDRAARDVGKLNRWALRLRT